MQMQMRMSAGLRAGVDQQPSRRRRRRELVCTAQQHNKKKQHSNAGMMLLFLDGQCHHCKYYWRLSFKLADESSGKINRFRWCTELRFRLVGPLAERLRITRRKAVQSDNVILRKWRVGDWNGWWKPVSTDLSSEL